MTTLSLLLLPTLFVAPNGDDRADGTAKHPLRTLPAAIARARGGRVVLRPGTYLVDRTIEIGADSRGLTVVAEKPGTARLLGGRVLTKWTPSDRPHVLVCDVADVPDLGEMRRRGFAMGGVPAGLELFFDGTPMTLARYPNVGWLRTGAVEGEKTFAMGDGHARSIKGDDVWAMGYWNFDWAESYERAEIEDGKLTLGEKPAFGVAAGRRFVLLNALSELDSPGEWFLDRKAKRLYFWPPSPLRERGPGGKGMGSEAVASTLEGPMFHLRDAEDVTLKGLRLEVGRAGAVRIEGGTRDRVENCLVRNFGDDGVDITDATDSGVVGCDLTGLGERGVHLGGGDRRTLTPAGLYAEDDHIWAYARWCRTYQPAVAVDGVGNRVVRCLLTDAPHNAVLLSGNDHLLEGNDVQRVCQETGDSGAFYMGRNPTMRGAVIRGNRFRDLGPKVTTAGNFTEVMSVYLDDGWPATTIQGNLFEGPGTGIMIGGGGDNAVDGNVFVGKNPAVHLDARGRGWAKDMILDPKGWNFPGKLREVDGAGPIYAARYPALRAEIAGDFRDPLGTRIVGNVAVGGTWLRLQDGLTVPDAEGNNAVLPADSLQDALKRLAKPIDLAKIGLRTTKGRPFDLAHG